MSPNVVDNEVATNNSAATRKAAEKERGVPQQEESFFKKYQIWFIIGGICAVFGLIAIIAVATGTSDGSSSSSSGTDKDIDVTGPTLAPSAGDNNVELPPDLDPDMDGLATFECEQEPYFDAAGRLIFTGCQVS